MAAPVWRHSLLGGLNFATYFNWAEKDELFHLRAPADQVFWDLGSNVTLAEITCLLRQHFGTVNQAEWFRTKLCNRKRKPDKELQQLYNEVCHLMSLAYHGPSSNLSHLTGHDAFL